MTRVYGGCIEPGGFELDNDVEAIVCPSCRGEALSRYWETCEGGSINQNRTIICTECSHAEGDLPDSFYESQAAHEIAYDPELDDIITKLGY